MASYGRRKDIIWIDGKMYYQNCNKCGQLKSSPKSVYCPSCFRQYTYQKKSNFTASNWIAQSPHSSITILVEYESLLIEFYEKVQKRNFWCSDIELYVEMIGLYNFFGKSGDLDLLQPKKQLQMMFKVLESKYHQIKLSPTKIKRPNAAGKPKKRPKFYTKSSE